MRVGTTRVFRLLLAKEQKNLNSSKLFDWRIAARLLERRMTHERPCREER